MKRFLATTALCLSVALTAAGCGGSAEQEAPVSGDTQQTPGQAGGPGGGLPGGSGKVVDVSGSTAQVQSQQSQVAVSWTGSTTFTKEVTTDASAIKVGVCVMAFGDPASGNDSSSGDVAVTTARITEPSDGSCTMSGGFGGPRGGGTPPSGAPEGGSRQRPTDLPSDGVSVGRGFGGAIGEVTKVTSAGFTVASQQPGSDDTKATSVTVTTGADTTYTTTAKASSSDVKAGVCVTSMGDADDTGAISAKTIAVSQPVDDACGFAGMRPRAGS